MTATEAATEAAFFVLLLVHVLHGSAASPDLRIIFANVNDSVVVECFR